MFGQKRSGEDLIYADPTAGEKPRKHTRRGLRILLAALIAALLLAAAAAILILLMRDQNVMRLRGLY
ncbi:MAG: hypothetical protein IKY17_00725 [Oscillospiraceae bacterium]|nr:hypothetical protein [Oscillospiraceae bacterium]